MNRRSSVYKRTGKPSAPSYEKGEARNWADDFKAEKSEPRGLYFSVGYGALSSVSTALGGAQNHRFVPKARSQKGGSESKPS